MASSSLLVPGAFQVKASNGYILSVAAVPPRAGHSGSIFIFTSGPGGSVSYKAPATVTETSMQADLGELGEISVTFQGTNRPLHVPACAKEKTRFESGHYEGTIDFHGEEGYTDVEATTAPASISVFCFGPFESGPAGPPRGARLHVRSAALGPDLFVSKRRPGAAALIFASTSEHTNGISIERFVGLRMPGTDFKYDRQLRTATVRPPAPFSGSAHFDLGKKAGRRWNGDLTVNLPGRTGVPLTGPALRATLVPSHGF